MRRLPHRFLFVAAAVVCAAIYALVAEAQTRGTPRGPAVSTYPAFSVRVFGARGDGVTDDTAAIQSAVNAGAAVGQPVVVPPGTYMVNAKMSVGRLGAGWDMGSDTGGVTLPSGTHLIIQAGATLKMITSDWYAGNVLRMLNNSNITIEGPGAIVGDRDTHDFTNPAVNTPINRSTQEWNSGINIRGATNVTVRGLSISNFTGDAIMVGASDSLDNDTKRIRIVNNYLDGSRRNNISVIDRSADVLIEGNINTNAGYNDAVHNVSGTPPRAGIDVEGGTVSLGTAPTGTVISGNTFRGSRGASVSIFNGIGTSVTGNFMDSSIGYANGLDASISGNVLRENPIFVPANFAAFAAGTTYMKGDFVQSAGAYYTSLSDANLGNTPPNATWWQVFAQIPGVYGLAVAGGVDTNSAVIAGNTINGFGNGLDLRGANAVASGNHIYKSRIGGILVYSVAGAVVVGNEVFQSPIGINVDATATQAIVGSNYVEGSTTVGIQSASPSASIRGNRVHASVSGIKITAGTASVTENHIRPDGVASESYQINCTGPATVFLKGNTVRGAVNTAFLGASNPVLKMVGNEFTGNTMASAAVSITSTARVELVDNVVSFARAANGGIGVSLGAGTTGALLLSNKIYSENAFTLTNPIKTDASAGSNKVVNNITSTGTVVLHGTDTNTGNVTF